MIRNPRLTAALKACRAGYSVVPIEPRGKRPLVEWVEFQRQRATEKRIREYWGEWPDANVGIVTGEISGLVVIDIDAGKVDDVEAVLEVLLDEAPSDMIVKTGGGGYHVYYEYTDPIRNKTGLRPGVDVRADGGLVVFPGSVHESGDCYDFIRNGAPGRRLPAMVADDPQPSRGSKSDEAGASPTKSDSWVSRAIGGVEEGSRNDTCARFAGFLIGRGYSLAETIERLLEWNQRNQPPMDEAEVVRTAESIFKRDLARHGADSSSDSSRQSKLVVISAADLLATPDVEIDWLLKSVLPAGTVGFVAAHPKQFKTFLLIAMGATIASGRRFAGHFEAPRPRRVLGIFAEDSRESLARRLELILTGVDIPAGELGDRFDFIIRPSFSIQSDDDLEELEQLIESGGYDVVFIDPLAEVFMGDENHKHHVAPPLMKLRRIRERTGAAILITHHLSKPGEWGRRADSPAKMRGSTYLWGWAECIFLLNPSEAGIEVDVTLKEAPAPDRFLLNVVMTDVGFAFQYQDANEVAQARDEALRRMILDFVEANPGASTRQIRDGVQGGRARIARTRAALVADGLLVVQQDGPAHRHYLAEQANGAHVADRGAANAPVLRETSGAPGRPLIGGPAGSPAHPVSRNPFGGAHGIAPIREDVIDGEVVWTIEIQDWDLDVVKWYRQFWPEMLDRFDLEEPGIESRLEDGRMAAYNDWMAREIPSPRLGDR